MQFAMFATYNDKPVYKQIAKLSVNDKQHLVIKAGGVRYESTKITEVVQDGCEIRVGTRSGSLYRIVCMSIDSRYPGTGAVAHAEQGATYIREHL